MFSKDYLVQPTEMPLVDGFGDEVLVLLGAIVVAVVIAFAWLSTRVSSSTSSYLFVQYDNSSLEVEDEQRSGASFRSEEDADEAALPAAYRPLVVSSSETAAPNGNAGFPESGVIADINRRTLCVNEADQSYPAQCCENGRSETSSSAVTGPDPDSGESNEAQLMVKLRFLDDSHRLVETHPSQCIGEFKRQNFASDLEEGKVVRLIYRGQLLRDDSRSLASYGLFDNCVVHCHVSRVPYNGVGETTGGAASSIDRSSSDYRGAVASISFDIGNLIYVLFGVKFAFLWAALYLYPDYFDSTSLLSLLFCSLVFLIFCLSAGRRRNAERQSPRVTVTAIASTNSTAS
ncbi:hypothetical protein M514_04517 [Trichuris suis]|uniref:Ubiquitin-like domain-containing protein n=1 Tax=Trichuris suis TaxID=68888 RepID=A0A085N611_9BILA|nr:hypothetical protein M514_04517 [Trichuris suis]